MRVCVALSLLVLGACGPGLGSADGSTDATSTSSNESVDTADEDEETTTGLDPTGCAGICIEPPPQPWRGPLGLTYTENPVAMIDCSATYPTRIASFGHMLIDTDLPCECECTPPVPSECEATLSSYADPGCAGAVASQMAPTYCDMVDGGSVQIDAPVITDTCTPWGVVPNPNFDLHTVLCEGALIGGCEGEQQCAPLPGPELEPSVCYWAPGELPCPPGFPSQQIVWSAVDDQRSCTEGCECSGSASCTGGVLLHDNCDRMEPKARRCCPVTASTSRARPRSRTPSMSCTTAWHFRRRSRRSAR